MDRIGLTGSTGSLGKIFLKKYRNKNIKCFRGDIRNKKLFNIWIKKNNINILLHFAAIVPIKRVNKDLKKAYDVNYIGTKNIVDACAENKIEWFFFTSTSHVYKYSKKKLLETEKKKPTSYYGKTKLLAENYIIKKFTSNNIPFCIGRIFSTANKNQKKDYLVPDLKRKIKKKGKVFLKNLNHYRDFVSMDDISKIILILYSKKYKGILNIASGKSIYLKDIAKEIINKYNKKNYVFKDNQVSTSLVGNNSKLMRIKKIKIDTSIKKLIF